MLHLAFYGVRAFERSMYSTLVPEQLKAAMLSDSGSALSKNEVLRIGW